MLGRIFELRYGFEGANGIRVTIKTFHRFTTLIEREKAFLCIREVCLAPDHCSRNNSLALVNGRGQYWGKSPRGLASIGAYPWMMLFMTHTWASLSLFEDN